MSTRKPQNVLVWLGEETEHTPIAFEVVRQLSKWYRLSDQEEHACSKAFEGGWFDRLWVVQEAVHAQSLVMRCGSFEIGWESLKQRVQYQLSAFSAFSTIANCRFLIELHLPDDLWVLDNFGGRKCYDPRDFVYALRSMLPCLTSVVPDYSLCTADVFVSASRAITFHWKDLRVFEATSKRGPSQCK
jgi:hypothetical protein